jgi:hypothetical protein
MCLLLAHFSFIAVGVFVLVSLAAVAVAINTPESKS